jgi:hypothetical protein
MCLVKENLNIVHGSVRVIYVHRIGEVIPHICLRTLIMNFIDSKIAQVLELRNDAGDITNPVAARVLEGSSITASFYHLCCSLL